MTVGSIVIFIRDYRMYTITSVYENEYGVSRADISDNETGDTVQQILFDDLELVQTDQD